MVWWTLPTSSIRKIAIPPHGDPRVSVLQQRNEEAQRLLRALQTVLPFHIWNSLVEKAGYKMSDASKTWRGHASTEHRRHRAADGGNPRLGAGCHPRFPDV
jgi:hypothetical protein